MAAAGRRSGEPSKADPAVAGASSSPSDLAAFVLGLVWQQGPCSAYAIRRMLLDSPSAQWSGSAGAIYPLVRRLEREGLLESVRVKGDRRGLRACGITAAGRAALQAWIGPPLVAGAISVSADPLRSRARFLAALAPKARQAWVVAARAALEEVARKAAAWHAEYASKDDPYLGLLTRHTELELDARRRWLDEVDAIIRETARPRGERRPPARHG
jgi:DNA-binding PadR family transcriptional regulator